MLGHGNWELHCECGWRKLYKNPIAARWGGEAHLPFCSFYKASLAITCKGEKEKPEMSRQSYFNDKSNVLWMKPSHVRHGQTLTVDTFEEIRNSLGLRPCVRFKELPEMVFTLNQTNYDFFAQHFGEDEFGWGGEKVVVSIEQISVGQFGERTVPGIRFKIAGTVAKPRAKKE
jgi:hypothetical protein